ncbi:nitroreductase family protein [Streptomyces sp. NPDC058128]|uniref:nitroreductase family protein n=1 Tax=Streptomyces sp. NPDC058128 TaxID=3346352 RepID=UPI0036E7BE55
MPREYAVKDAVIAAPFVMPAATEMGLATSPMNGWDEAEVKKVIGIGDRDGLAIALLVSVGYPARLRGPSKQRSPSPRAPSRATDGRGGWPGAPAGFASREP